MKQTINPVVIGGSAGSFRFLTHLLPELGEKIPFPLLICVHRSRSQVDGIAGTLKAYTPIKLQDAKQEEELVPGKIYIAPARSHMTFDSTGRIQLQDTPPVNYSKPSIDVTMQSAAATFGSHAIGILLSGANNDGASGLFEIHKQGGVTVVQDPEDAEINVMPESALNIFTPDFILPARKIISFIRNLAENR